MKNKNNTKNKKIILTVIILAVLAGAAVFLFVRSANDNAINTDQQTAAEDGIDYSPATEADKQENDRHKAELGAEIDAEKNSGNKDSSTKKQVKPDITSISQDSKKVEASARVPGVIEDGGTCTFIFTRGASTVTKKSTGVSNVSETSCGFIEVDKSKLSKGTWLLTVKYNSNKASGSSGSEQIEVK